MNRGHTQVWSVAARYEIADHYCLVAHESEGICHEYNPMEFPQVLTDFARIKWWDEKAVLSFAERWGRLGFPRKLPGEISAEDDARLEEIYERALDPREELMYIWIHSTAIRDNLTLLKFLQGGDIARLANYMVRKSSIFPYNSTVSDVPPTLSRFEVSIGMAYKIEVPFGPAQKGQSWPQAVARYAIQEQVNEVLSGSAFEHLYQEGSLDSRVPIHPSLEVSDRTGDQAFVMSYRFGMLLQAIYLHLARFAINGPDRRIEICEECGEFFVQTNRNQRFCPPDHRTRNYVGKKGARAQSACAARYRQRRHRNREGG